jgi:hypothetical protein
MQKILRICTITLCIFLGTTQTSQAQTPSLPRVWLMTANENARSINTITFNVTFSEGVTGVDVSDFVTSGDDQNARIASVLQGSTNDKADTYVVEVMLSGPSTHLALTLFDDDSITNTAHIPLGGVGKQNGNAMSAAVTPSYSTEASGGKTTQVGQPVLTKPLPRSILNIVGNSSSLALTATDAPVISYYDYTHKDLKLAVCNDTTCLSPVISTVAKSGDVGETSSLALTSANIPVMSYLDFSNYDLKLAVCNNTACSNPVISTLDSKRGTGATSSLALTTDNRPVISYFDDTDNDLKLAICNNSACSNPVTSTLDSAGDVGWMSSLALTTDNVPVISYYDFTKDVLKLAFCDDAACLNPTFSILDGSGASGMSSSLALTTPGNIPVISYSDWINKDLKLAVCNDSACTSSSVSTLDSIGDVWGVTALALSATNIPVISYSDLTTKDLKLAVCNDSACTNPTISNLDSIGDVGTANSLALTTANIPVISYYDQTNGNLKLLQTVPSLKAIIDRGQPNSFAKVLPIDGKRITAATTTLSWAASTYATSYAYCYALSIAACTTWTSAGTATTARIGLSQNGTYYWQIRATNTSGTTLADSASYGSFTVSLPPASFAKSSPANNATKQKTSVKLTWAASTRATSYEYCIALTTTACSTWKSTGTARTASVTGLAKNKSYYWQVRARNTAGTTLSSSTFWKFTTAP